MKYSVCALLFALGSAEYSAKPWLYVTHEDKRCKLGGDFDTFWTFGTVDTVELCKAECDRRERCATFQYDGGDCETYDDGFTFGLSVFRGAQCNERTRFYKATGSCEGTHTSYDYAGLAEPLVHICREMCFSEDCTAFEIDNDGGCRTYFGDDVTGEGSATPNGRECYLRGEVPTTPIKENPRKDYHGSPLGYTFPPTAAPTAAPTVAPNAVSNTATEHPTEHPTEPPTGSITLKVTTNTKKTDTIPVWVWIVIILVVLAIPISGVACCFCGGLLCFAKKDQAHMDYDAAHQNA